MEGIILTCVVYPLCGVALFGILLGIECYKCTKEEERKEAKRKTEESFDAFRPRINYFKKH